MNQLSRIGIVLLLIACKGQSENIVISHECDEKVAGEAGCDTPCGPGVRQCRAGYWSACVPKDVDGGICSGTSQTAGAGGTRSGNGGTPGQPGTAGGSPPQGANGGEQPSGSGAGNPDTGGAEGNDDLCAGTTEGCECRTDASRWCDGGKGVCHDGKQTCDDSGFWGACVPVTPASPELCDGVDNDCDDDVDEGFHLEVPCNFAGKCPQSRSCDPGGASSSCKKDELLFSEEICDGIDNDCDELVDRVLEHDGLRSVCSCERTPLVIGNAVDISIADDTELCAPTVCGADRPVKLMVDGTCYPSCQTASDADGDGWGYEDGASCLVADSARGQSATPCPGESIPIGMAMSYCLDCHSETPVPYAMCQSVPRFDLTEFQQGKLWLKVDYTFTSTHAAELPVNLWITTEGDNVRKRLPLVRRGDLPGDYTVTLRANEACFTPSTAFGASCPGSGTECELCGEGEVCGALDTCGDYGLTQAWLQIAAEFCVAESGNQAGTVKVNHVELVQPNCDD